MHPLIEHLCAQLDTLPHKRITIALSGGLDSIVLLHLLHRVRAHKNLDIHAVHVHHGLSPHADDWQQFCQDVCARWQIPFRTEKVHLNTHGLGIEAAARQVRYAALTAHNSPVIALAHHADDQIETLLLGIMRGGGLRALSAMPVQRRDESSGSVILWRPLLSQSRDTLEKYAKQHDLLWIHDESNDDTQHYLRNFVRHECLPMLHTRLPHASQQLLASVNALQDDLAALNEWIAQEMHNIRQNGAFRVSLWRKLDAARAQACLRQWLHDEGLGVPSRAAIMNMAHTLRHAERGHWRMANGQAWFYRDRLMALTRDEEALWFWLEGAFSGSLHEIFTRLNMPAPHFRLPEESENGIFYVRAAMRDDKIGLKNGDFAVMKLLAQRGVPAPLRTRFPVLSDAQNRVMAVLNVCVCAQWASVDAPQYAPLHKWIIAPNKIRQIVDLPDEND